MFRSSRIRVALVIAAVWITLAPAHAASVTRVIIGLPSISVNQLAFHSAREAGFFAAEGIEIVAPLIRPNIAITGMLNGEVDYTLAGDSAAFAAVTGVQVRHIGCINRHQAFQFIVSPRILNPSDLKKKTVAVTSVASTTDIITHLVLRHLGLTQEDGVQFVATGTTANALAALQSDRAAGALLSPPFDTQAQQLGYRSILTIGDVIPMPPTCFGTSVKKLVEQPDQVRALLRASLKGARLVVGDRERSVGVLMRLFKLSREVAEAVYKTHRGAFDTDGSPTSQQLQFLIQQGQQRQTSRREISLEDFTDYRLLREVQREFK